ncbi:MAG: dephospho-CoA kinase [Actinomycetota bacterium]
MLVVGLTGGIGSGKSTLAALLAERGAQIIDADAHGRDALRPDRPAWHSVVGQFGDGVLQANSMEIDRKRLAAVVFNDSNKLAALNAIVHPVILQKIADDLERLSGTDEIVVLDAALIFEVGLDDSLDVLVAVTAEPELRMQRLRSQRHMDLADIDARMASQMNPEEVDGRADVLVVNDGTLEDLGIEADRVWAELQKRNSGDAGPTTR